MKMVERVALALYSESNAIDIPDEWPAEAINSKPPWLAYAAVAIKAMREPADEMLDAADAVGHDCLQWSLESGEGLDGMDWIPAWEAMIDAALRQSKEAE